MARDGYRIFDSDTHVGPDAAILVALSERRRKGAAAPAGREYKSRDRSRPRHLHQGPAPLSPPARRRRARRGAGRLHGRVYRREARRASPRRWSMPIPAARIADMDFEGVDVNLTLPSGWFGTWTAGDDVALEMAMYRAYHRWMADYCGAYPEPARRRDPGRRARHRGRRSPRSAAGASRAGPGA